MRSQASVTNLIELFGDQSIRELLILCGNSPTILQTASDYELLLYWLKALPMLSGHPLTARLKTVVRFLLCSEIDPCEKNAEAIWSQSYERLLCEPRTKEEWLATFPTTPSDRALLDTVWDTLYAQTKTVSWCGNDLIQTTASSWKAWEREMTALLQEKRREGVREILLRIPSDYEDISPNVYAVEQCLKKKTKGRADDHMLLSQVIRFLSVQGDAAGLCVVLDVACHEAALSGLLNRIEKAGMLRDLLLTSTEDTLYRSAVTWLLGCKDPTSVRLAIHVSDASKEYMQARLISLSAYYPIGRVVGVKW